MDHEVARSHDDDNDDDGSAIPEPSVPMVPALNVEDGFEAHQESLVWPPAEADLDDLEVIEIPPAPLAPPAPLVSPVLSEAPVASPRPEWRADVSTPLLLPVATLRAPEVALQWHEAVAIVAELSASIAHMGPGARVPGVSHFFLSGEGAVVEALVGSGGEPAVPGLGRLLDWLTQGLVVPDELRALIDTSLADPPGFASTVEFAGALAFFERPGRRTLLAALAARASEVAAQEAMNEELERLKVKAREAAARAADQPQESPSRWWRLPVVARLAVVAAFVGSVLTTVVLAILFWPAASAEGPPATLADRAQARVERLVDAGLAVLRPEPPPTLEPVVAEAEAPAPPPSPATRTARRVAATEAVESPRAPGGSRAAAEQWSVVLEAADRAEPPDPAPDRRVYSAADPDVVPPEFVRQQLPTDPPPGMTLGDVGVLEILVNESGQVDNVRLVAREGRFQERMILAAAKAWQFIPAAKDGRPVKYRTRVRVTL